MVIFKRKQMIGIWSNQWRPTQYEKYMFRLRVNVSTLFLEWTDHFIKCTRLEKSEKKQVLLILYGHSTNTSNIDTICLAREYGIELLLLPAHTSLQHIKTYIFKSLIQILIRLVQIGCLPIIGWASKFIQNFENRISSSPIYAIHNYKSCELWPYL